MRVRLLLRDTIEDYIVNHANSKIHFNNWLESIIERADWNEPKDVTSAFSANLLGAGSNRVIFDIGGNGRNAHRMICEYMFGLKYVRLYVNWIGTHEEYNVLTDKEKRTISIY